MSLEGAELVLLGATWNGQPVGIVIGSYRPLIESELYTLAVAPKPLIPEISTQLLISFENVIKEKGATALRITFLSDASCPAPIQTLILSQGWKAPSLSHIRLYFDPSTFSPPWLHRTYPVPRSCKQFFWKDLKKEERIQLEHLIEQRAIPFQISPFNKEKQIDWNTSLGMRNDQEVVGWIVNLRPNDKIVEFRSFFVFADYFTLGHAIRLLSESIHKLQEKPTKTAVLEAYMGLADSRWLKFIKKRLMPFSTKIERYWEAWKKFE